MRPGLALIGLCLTATLRAETVSTVAGDGTAGYAGDGSSATAASLNAPLAVLPDSTGGYFIADTGNHVVRWVSSAGFITTVAGTGVAGYGGDGGPGTAAQLSAPASLALSASGDLYISDAGDHRIRRLSAGSITTVAGTGAASFGGDNGPALAAPLNQPRGLRVAGNGTVYFVDSGNFRLRAITAAGIISTVAGNGSQGTPAIESGPGTAQPLNWNWGLAFSALWNLRFSEYDNNAVLTLSFSDGRLYHTAGTGGAGGFKDGSKYSSKFNGPRGLAVDSSGALYTADSGNHRIRYQPNQSFAGVYTAAGTGSPGFGGDGGPALNAQFNLPSDVALDAGGNLYVADTGNHRIRKIDAPPFRPPLDTLFDDGSINSYPNPFRPGLQTTLTFVFPSAGKATLEIYDCGGAKAYSRVLTEAEAKRGIFDWNGRDDGGNFLPSGIYVAAIVSERKVRRCKFTVLWAAP